MKYFLSYSHPILITASLLLITGCASTLDSNTKTTAISESNLDRVAKCQYIGMASSNKSLSGGLSSSPAFSSNQEAKNMAAAMGGTHIVWTKNTNPTVATADVYDCSEGNEIMCTSKLGPTLLTECEKK